MKALFIHVFMLKIGNVDVDHKESFNTGNRKQNKLLHLQFYFWNIYILLLLLQKIFIKILMWVPLHGGYNHCVATTTQKRLQCGLKFNFSFVGRIKL